MSMKYLMLVALSTSSQSFLFGWISILCWLSCFSFFSVRFLFFPPTFFHFTVFPLLSHLQRLHLLNIYDYVPEAAHLWGYHFWSYILSSFPCMPDCFSRVQLFATLWTVAHWVPLPMEFSRQEYWSGCWALLQGIFPTQGPNLHLFCLEHQQVGSLPLAPLEKPFKFLSCGQFYGLISSDICSVFYHLYLSIFFLRMIFAYTLKGFKWALPKYATLSCTLLWAEVNQGPEHSECLFPVNWLKEYWAVTRDNDTEYGLCMVSLGEAM